MLETKSSQNSNLSSIGFILILLGLAFIYFYGAPNIKTAKQLHADTAAKEEALATDVNTLQKAQADIANKEYQLSNLGITKDSLASVMPATEDMPSLYIQLENLIANSNAVQKPTYVLGNPALTEAGEVRVPVSFSATGKYADLKAFVTTLENNIRPITFSTISFSQASEVGEDGKAQLSADSFSLSAVGFFRARAVSPAYSADAAAPQS